MAKVIIKMDTGHTFEHKDGTITVATWVHVIEGDRERMYNSDRILWIEKDKTAPSPHKTVSKQLGKG